MERSTLQRHSKFHGKLSANPRKTVGYALKRGVNGTKPRSQNLYKTCLATTNPCGANGSGRTRSGSKVFYACNLLSDMQIWRCVFQLRWELSSQIIFGICDSSRFSFRDLWIPGNVLLEISTANRCLIGLDKLLFAFISGGSWSLPRLRDVSLRQFWLQIVVVQLQHNITRELLCRNILDMRYIIKVNYVALLHGSAKVPWHQLLWHLSAILRHIISS